MTRLVAAIAAAVLFATPIAAQDSKRPQPKRTPAFFSEQQEAPAIPAEELAARAPDAKDDEDGYAAEVALNDWKLCLYDALAHWAALPEGVGTLVDGAFGHCADGENAYRTRLQHISQNGRTIIDLQMARSMTRNLRDVWRPRLIAAALDQLLATKRASEQAPISLPPPPRR